MTAGVSMEMAAALMSAALGPCRHETVVPVELLVTGEHVANICAGCHRGLPMDWSGEVTEVRRFGRSEPVAFIPCR